MDQKFSQAVEKVLEHEGGYANDPADPGGETNFGISRRSYPSLEIKSLTRERATEIYFRDWWERYGYGAIEHGPLAEKIFDLSVNVGPARAHGLLQEAVNQTRQARLKVDGILGPATLAAVNSHPVPELLLAALKLAAVRFYLGLNRPRFLAGWVKRAVG